MDSWTDEVPELAALDPEARRILDREPVREAPPDLVLFRPGEAVKGYVIVLSGRIGVYLVGPSGRDVLLYRVEPGDSCIQSTLGLLTDDDYTAEAITEAPTRFVLLPPARFRDLLDRSAGFRSLVFTALAERVQSLMHLVEDVAFQPIAQRLARHLLSMADDKGVVHATHAQIATEIGTAREVVSRRLDRLAREGVLSLSRGEVRLVNRERLAQLADQPAL